jgi:hypothetical protein
LGISEEGYMSKESEIKNETSYRLAYEAVNQHWIHAETIRWTILSNFLTGNSIFILTWAAILSSTIYGKAFLLGLTALSGCTLSVIWLAIEVRSSIFINQYSTLGKYLEEKLSIKKTGPFHRSVALRAAQKKLPEKEIPVVEPIINYSEIKKTENVIEQILGPTPTYLVIIIIPSVFIVVYIFLFTYSMFLI